MTRINKTIPAVAVAAFLMFSGSAMAATAVSVDELLQQVQQGRVKDAEENAAAGTHGLTEGPPPRPPGRLAKKDRAVRDRGP